MDWIGRIVAIVLGVAGVAAGSQAPNFASHTMQNIEGRIDELRRIVESIRADRAEIGYTRDQARETCAAALEPLFQKDCARNEQIESRYEALTALQARLRSADPWSRPVVLARAAGADPVVREVAQNAMVEFQPAIPATAEGLTYAAGAGGGLWGLARLLFASIDMPFRRSYAY